MTERSSNESNSLPGKTPQEYDPNAQRAFLLLGNFLEQDGWHPQRLEDRFVYGMLVNGKNGDIRCYAHIRMDLEQFIFYAVSPIKAGDEVRRDVAEFITRANFGLRIGNFELDYMDGSVRYKSSLDFEGEILTAGLIRNAIYSAVRTMDDYLGGLMRVIFAGLTPLEAIQEVEGAGSN
jgi:hypothetical protein